MGLLRSSQQPVVVKEQQNARNEPEIYIGLRVRSQGAAAATHQRRKQRRQQQAIDEPTQTV